MRRGWKRIRIILEELSGFLPHPQDCLPEATFEEPTEETDAMSEEWLPTLDVFLCLLNWKLISEAVSDSVCKAHRKRFQIWHHIKLTTI